MSIAEKEKEIIEEFALFGDDWEMKYDHLISLGRSLKPMDPSLKTDDRLIRGCQSRVWLHAEIKDGHVHFIADSDAIITKGLIALLVMVLDGQPAEEIVKAKLGFIDAIGLSAHLSPTRANGLVSMVTTMKSEALKAIKHN